MAKECGLAKNTASAQLWLDQCEAVSTVETLNDEWLEFIFDPAIEVYAVPEHIVWFDQGAAPTEALEVLNEVHNGVTDEVWLDRLTHRISDGTQDIHLAKFAETLGLDERWDWGDVQSKLAAGEITRESIEHAMCEGVC